MTLNNDEIINSLKGKVPHLKLKKKPIIIAYVQNIRF